MNRIHLLFQVYVVTLLTLSVSQHSKPIIIGDGQLRGPDKVNQRQLRKRKLQNSVREPSRLGYLNDYYQFKRYESGSNFTIGAYKLNQPGNDTSFPCCISGDYYVRAEKCEKDVRIINLGWCAEGLTQDLKRLGSNNEPHWNRYSDSLPSCRYEIISSLRDGVQELENKTEGLVYKLLTIRAVNCTADWTSQGGSSFEVIARGLCLGSCKLYDNFNHTYDLKCALCNLQPQHLIRIPRRECRNVSITLDYEHFDAYSERGAYYNEYYAPLRFPLVQNAVFCAHISSHEDGSGSSSSSGGISAVTVNNDERFVDGDYVHHNKVDFKFNHAHYGNESSSSSAVTSGSWIRVQRSDINHHLRDSFSSLVAVEDEASHRENSAGEIVNNDAFLRHTTINNVEVNSSHPASSSSHVHVWRWDNPVDTVSLGDCVSRKAVYMLGESHLRYIWDALVVDATNNTEFLRGLDSHHSNFAVGSVHYRQAFFAGHINGHIDFLCNDIASDLRHGAGPARYTVVFQTGAWEFNYWATRVVINSSAEKLLYSIRNAKAQGCGDYLSLIFLTAMPYPVCETLTDAAQSMTCTKSRFARNNYATSAFNEYFLEQLREIDYPRMQVVDAFNIVSARLEYGESGKCCNHFLCRDTYAEVFTAAPAGRIVLEAVERAICKASEG